MVKNAIKELKELIKNNNNINIDFNIDDLHQNIILNVNSSLLLKCTNIKIINKKDCLLHAISDGFIERVIIEYLHTNNIKFYNNSIELHIKKDSNYIYLYAYDNELKKTVLNWHINIKNIYIDIDYNNINNYNINDFIILGKDDITTNNILCNDDFDLIYFNKNLFLLIDNILKENELIKIENFESSYL